MKRFHNKNAHTEPQRETRQFEKAAGHFVAIVDHRVKIHIALGIDR